MASVPLTRSPKALEMAAKGVKDRVDKAMKEGVEKAMKEGVEKAMKDRVEKAMKEGVEKAMEKKEAKARIRRYADSQSLGRREPVAMTWKSVMRSMTSVTPSE